MFEVNTKTGVVFWGDFVITPETTLTSFVTQYPESLSSQQHIETGGLVRTTYELGHQPLEDRFALGSVGFWDQRISGITLDPVDDSSNDDPWWTVLERWIPAARRWLHARFGDPIEMSSGGLFDEEEECPPEVVALIDTNWLYRFAWGKIVLHYESLGSRLGLSIIYEHKARWLNEEG